MASPKPIDPNNPDSPVVDIPINPTGNAETDQEIDDYFTTNLGGSAPGTPSEGGGTQFQSTDGGTLTVFGTGTAAPKKISGDVVIQSGQKDVILGGKGAEKDNKVLIADNADHTVKSGGGNDVVTLAGTGDNFVKTGKGADTIVSGQGNDTMNGGQGRDTFVFKNIDTGADTIKGFKPKDVIQIADRTGDGQLTKGKDFTIEKSGKDVIITLNDKDGKPTANKITVEKAKLDKVDEAIKLFTE